MHGYVDPTLIDGLTKPHNPGLRVRPVPRWNQPRVDENEAALADVGMNITRPVNQWNSLAGRPPKPVGPAYAEGWDDWGPFYTQTYMEFFGVDSSTLEMCNAGPGATGGSGPSARSTSGSTRRRRSGSSTATRSCMTNSRSSAAA